MSNPVLVFENINDATITASAGSAANYPITNLQDGRYATQWKAGAKTINQTLIIELPTAKTMANIFFANHNFNTVGAEDVVVSYSSDGVTYSGDTVIPDLSAEPISLDLVSAFKKYAKITFAKTSGSLTNEPTIGLIYLGRKSNIPLYSNNVKRGLKADLVRDESLSGLKFRSSSYLPRQTWKIDFAALRKANNAELFRFLNYINIGLHPFWFKDMDDNWHFVGIDSDAVESNGKGNLMFDWRNLQFTEERVGITIALPGGYSI